MKTRSQFAFRGNTSFPYLSGYTWASFCDWHMLNTDYAHGPARFNPESVMSGDKIFLDYNCLADFSSRILPKIKVPFVLVTGNYGYGADHLMPGPFSFLLEEDKVIAWFVQNIDRAPSNKLIPIPIGLANKNWEHGNTDLFDALIPSALKKRKRSNFCYLNFSLWKNRLECLLHFQTIGFQLTQRTSFESYLNDLSNSIFVVSPEGNGIDCHRTWESLLMGCYPIVKSSTLNPLYIDLPVVIVDNWSEVNPEFLKEKEEYFKSRTWALERLYAPYWSELFRNYTRK